MDGFPQSSARKGCKALVQPKVLKIEVGHQNSSPGVRDLVRYHPRVGLVAWEDGGRDKGEAGVLHAPVGEGGGQHQDVILPFISDSMIKGRGLMSEKERLREGNRDNRDEARIKYFFLGSKWNKERYPDRERQGGKEDYTRYLPLKT